MRRQKHTPDYIATLESVNANERALVPVSVSKPYFWGSHLEAMLIALADKKLALKDATFLIADRLQRHTHYMKRIARLNVLIDSMAGHIDRGSEDWVADLRSAGILEADQDLSDDVANAVRSSEDWKAVLDAGIKKHCLEKSIHTGEAWREHVTDKIEKLERQGHLKAGVFFKNYGKDSQKLRHFHWARLTEKEEFPAKQEAVDLAYGENTSEFATIVDEAASAFVDQFITQNRDEQQSKKPSNPYAFPLDTDEKLPAFKVQLFEICKVYILEESAVIMLLMEERASDVMAYPFLHNSTNGKLYECIRTLCELVEDKQLGTDGPKLMRPVITVFRENRAGLQPTLDIQSPSPVLFPPERVVVDVKRVVSHDRSVRARSSSTSSTNSADSALGTSPKEEMEHIFLKVANMHMQLMDADLTTAMRLRMHVSFMQFGSLCLQYGKTVSTEDELDLKEPIGSDRVSLSETEPKGMGLMFSLDGLNEEDKSTGKLPNSRSANGVFHPPKKDVDSYAPPFVPQDQSGRDHASPRGEAQEKVIFVGSL